MEELVPGTSKTIEFDLDSSEKFKGRSDISPTRGERSSEEAMKLTGSQLRGQQRKGWVSSKRC